MARKFIGFLLPWLLLIVLGCSSASGAVYYYHTDQLGSVRLVTDAQGHVARGHDYLPFGEEVSAAAGEPLGFTGKPRDTETGLDYFSARYYGSRLGRFLSVDPARERVDEANPRTWNRYTYANNNPLIFVDPDGKSATVIGGVTGFLAGGGMALAQGKSRQEVLAAATAGGLSGVMMGSVIDSGGAALPILLAAGAFSGAAGGSLERSLLGKPSTALDVALDATGGLVGAQFGAALSKWVPQAVTIGTVQVFRVEGYINTRLAIDASGNVMVAEGENMLFLNFGQRARAEAFLAQRLQQGMEGAEIKSFRVSRSLLRALRAGAVTENAARENPGRLLMVDVTKAPDQFGLRAAQIEQLKKAIIQGSGKVGN